jgi:mRNA-degrading endonuclease RelE of RelBE toxin-antitoxin system
MKLEFTRRGWRDYQALPQQVRARMTKQLRMLLLDLRHPSLHAKKYDESRDVWQGRVTRDWRFYFTIEGDVYRIHTIMRHPK